jgi:transcription initiation factor TFIID subunit 11
MASPPHIPTINHPRKRGSISSLNGGLPKKRKPSHLRNAFSPESEGAGSPARYSRSPSVDSVATTSVVNGGGGKKRKKGGDAASVVSSVRGGRGKGADGADGGEGGDGADGGEYEDEDDEDDMGVEMDMAGEEGGMNAEERRNQEKEHERYVHLTGTLVASMLIIPPQNAHGIHDASPNRPLRNLPPYPP